MSKNLYIITVLVTEKKVINVFAHSDEEAAEAARKQAGKYGNVTTRVMGCERKAL